MILLTTRVLTALDGILVHNASKGVDVGRMADVVCSRFAEDQASVDMAILGSHTHRCCIANCSTSSIMQYRSRMQQSKASEAHGAKTTTGNLRERAVLAPRRAGCGFTDTVEFQIETEKTTSPDFGQHATCKKTYQQGSVQSRGELKVYRCRGKKLEHFGLGTLHSP